MDPNEVKRMIGDKFASNSFSTNITLVKDDSVSKEFLNVMTDVKKQKTFKDFFDMNALMSSSAKAYVEGEGTSANDVAGIPEITSLLVVSVEHDYSLCELLVAKAAELLAE